MPEILDPALLRPGRLDKIIDFHLPSLAEREEIISYYLKKISIGKDLSFLETCKRLAELTPGFSSAEIKNIINESAIVAVRRGKDEVDDLDFEEAIERVIAGTERIGESFVE
jgi:ATP-dependent Zn protease